MRPNLAATETVRLGIDPFHELFEALAILLLRDGPWARLFCFDGMVAEFKFGGIPWEGEQAFGSDLALDVGLQGRGSRRLTWRVKVLSIFFIVFCVTMPFFSGYLSTFLGEYAIFFDK